jgi:hypothetical protein
MIQTVIPSCGRPPKDDLGLDDAMMQVFDYEAISPRKNELSNRVACTRRMSHKVARKGRISARGVPKPNELDPYRNEMLH